MKKFLLTILLISSPVFAFEDYMVISDVPVKSVSVQNNDVLDAKILYTIDNEKKFVILTPQKIGKTKVYLHTNDGQKNIEVKVDKNNTKLSVPDGLTCYELDNPPESYYIPEPPREIKILQPPRGVK